MSLPIFRPRTGNFTAESMEWTSRKAADILSEQHQTGQKALAVNHQRTIRQATDQKAGTSLGKVVDMLYAKQIPFPTGKAKWTRATVDHLLSSSKYILSVGFESFASAQFEKVNRCNIDYDKAGAPRKRTHYIPPAMPLM